MMHSSYFKVDRKGVGVRGKGVPRGWLWAGSRVGQRRSGSMEPGGALDSGFDT